MERPLEGVRVVDLTDGGGTETTARILADLGADTIRVEPRSRHAGLYDLVHNANKRSVVLDGDSERFLALVASADILITSVLPGAAPSGLDAEDLAARFPALVVVSVTPYGRTGPYRDWAATESTHLALGGVLSRSGLPGRDPLLPPGSLASESAAAQAAWAALVAYSNRLDTGFGDLVDCSVYESTVQVIDPGFGIGGSATGGVPAFTGPRGRPDARHLYPIFPCADGWVRICVLSARQWRGMFAWLGEPAEFADPIYDSLGYRFRAAGQIHPAIGTLFAGMTRAQAMAGGEEYGVPTAALATPAEALDHEQFAARGAFTDVALADGRTVRIPDGLLEVDGRRAGIRTVAPEPGAHTREVLDALPAAPPASQLTATPTRTRPLAGLRVLDLGVIVVGAETGRLFADMGAEVIKIENCAFPDGSRQSLDGSAMNAGIAYGHRNKLGLGLNLRSPGGIAIFRRLVAESDVVLSNFKPGTMESLGLGAAELAAVNPRIVVADSSAFGPSGPWSRKMGYGPLVRAATGLSGLWRFPDDEGSFSDASTIYPDHAAARIEATAVLAKLIDRRRTGLGGTVSVAQAEVILGQLGTQLAQESLAPGGLVAGSDRVGAGIHPCAGEDEWCVVEVRGDTDRARLAAIVGSDAHDLVTAWTRIREPRAAMTELQAAGVPAAMMQRIPGMLDDPQLAARGFLRHMTHPLLDRDLPCENGPAVFGGVADPPLEPAPLPGEHSRRVLMDVLGMTAAEVDRLIADGTVETQEESPMPDLDPRTPVLVGVGQASERIDDPGYRRLSAVDLAAEAAREALADTGADPAAIAAALDTVAGIRQFEISVPGARAPLGRSDNYPRSVAGRIGATPARAILEVAGGQGPQHLVSELAASIAAGRSEAALVFGSEAISTVQHLAKADDRPDFTEHVDGDIDDRGFGLKGLVSMHQTAHGLTGAPAQYAMLDNARRARLKQGREEYARSMGELFAPFTRVAATNPHASAPTVRDADELVTVTDTNRMIADPYPRYVVARDKVNQGAAVLLTSVGAAERLGIPRDRWVFLHGHADLRERDTMERDDLSRSPAAVMAARHALEVAGIGVDDVATFDLYSCFPIAVSNVADGLGVTADDLRGLTLTGGLPFFGGAGNNYSMHGIAETVQRMRAAPGSYGFVGANGGVLSKYSVGIYSTTPGAWRPDLSARLQAEIDAWPAPEEAIHADGWATIETYTINHTRQGAVGIVIGRLEADGRRFVARSADDDPGLLAHLGAGEPIGTRVFVRSFGIGNRVTVDEERMDELFPPRAPAFRDDYEHVVVRRAGHVLEVTINRPDARNSLHPPANTELDEVFDAYFADPDLWVAILTGAGDKAFSAGNDLVYSASGKPMYVPKNGFAGLTSRRTMPKPVIAAVNGFAMGGGCEIALACHLVVADSTARFALSEVRVGLVAGAGGLIRLPRSVPRKLATEMILTGRRLSAAEALDAGLVNRVVDAGTALDGARALAAEILEGSPTSVRVSLEIMAETEGFADTMDAVTHRPAALDELMASEDATEGITAFAQKRAPRWHNR